MEITTTTKTITITRNGTNNRTKKKQYLRTMSNGEKHGKLIIILPLSYYYDLWKNCVRKRMALFVAFGCVLCVRMSERVRENQRAREMLGMIDKERKGKRYRVITC